MLYLGALAAASVVHLVAVIGAIVDSCRRAWRNHLFRAPRRSSWHIAAAVSSLVGCASGPQQPPASSNKPDAGRDLTGPELERSEARDAKERAACSGATYGARPSEGLVSVTFRLRADIPSYSQPIRVCVLLDGRRLLTDRDALDVARQLATGETSTIRAAATPGVQHEVVLRTEFDGPEQYRGFHFTVRSHRAIVASAADELPIVNMHLYELPVLQLERRPTHRWSVSGPITIDRE